MELQQQFHTMPVTFGELLAFVIDIRAIKAPLASRIRQTALQALDHFADPAFTSS